MSRFPPLPTGGPGGGATFTGLPDGAIVRSVAEAPVGSAAFTWDDVNKRARALGGGTWGAFAWGEWCGYAAQRNGTVYYQIKDTAFGIEMFWGTSSATCAIGVAQNIAMSFYTGTGFGIRFQVDNTGAIIPSGHRLQFVTARALLAQGADVALAATTTVGNGNLFRGTGTGTVDYITTTGWQAGSGFKFIIPNGGTFAHNSASPGGSAARMKIIGAANIVAAANGTLVQLEYDGTNWITWKIGDLAA